MQIKGSDKKIEKSRRLWKKVSNTFKVINMMKRIEATKLLSMGDYVILKE